jgi:hypothetical protein
LSGEVEKTAFGCAFREISENLISISQKTTITSIFLEYNTLRASGVRTENFYSIVQANMSDPSDVKPRVTQPLAGLRYALKTLKTVPQRWI